MKDIIDIDKWKKKLSEFVDERNWRDFHNPKNLAMNLSVESAELAEIFTWVNSEDSKEIYKDVEKFNNIKHEVGDVLMTLIMIADELNINLGDALSEKVKLTEEKYPSLV